MEATIVGIFTTEEQARETIDKMKREGFTSEEISMVAKDGEKEEGSEASYEDQNLADGTTTGGALGGLAGLLAGAGAILIPGIGPIIAAGPLAGALTGVVSGGIAGGLIDYGIPEERGKHYEERVRQGDIFLSVQTDEDKTDRASEILSNSGAEDVEIH